MFGHKRIAAAIAIIAVLCGFAYADTIIVAGGEWGLNMDGWPNGEEFTAGDVLEFDYDTNYQDVWIVNKHNYDSCTPSGARLHSGHDYVILSTGTHYFISGFPDMCKIYDVKAEVIAH
ncbi:PREDICTED: basic blue protein-like [Ipomoea nil]|uniref:basic blue protein-like n=1 Tax=Ipomoea nil TaxID=35883 RepID=UPI000900E64D|nr:PREDICTED: basic blue protein-like [Ipomoea nil]